MGFLRLFLAIAAFSTSAFAAQATQWPKPEPVTCEALLSKIKIISYERHGDAYAPAWALSHAKQTLEELAPLVSPLRLPPTLHITVHPLTARLSPETAGAYTGYFYVDTTSQEMGFQLRDRRTFSPVLSHEIGHQILNHGLLTSLLNSKVLQSDMQLSLPQRKIEQVRKLTETRGSFPIGYDHASGRIGFLVPLRARADSGTHYQRTDAERLAIAWMDTPIVSAMGELFADVIGVVHSRDLDIYPNTFGEFPERSFRDSPANPSVRALETTHGFLWKVRRHIGKNYLRHVGENPERDAKVIRAVHDAILWESMRLYTAGEFTPLQSKVFEGTPLSLTRKIDELLASESF